MCESENIDNDIIFLQEKFNQLQCAITDKMGACPSRTLYFTKLEAALVCLHKGSYELQRF